jgi:DNA-binding MarR family transcriptional regulator
MAGTVEDEEVSRFLAAWFEVRQFIQAANFNHFQKAGLSATQFMILNLLPETGEALSIGELARRMNLKPATIAKTVDTLEERKMLARAKSGDDGRLVLLRITSEGKKLQNAAVGHFREQIGEIFRAIPNEDREALLKGLESFAQVSGKANLHGDTSDKASSHGHRDAPQARHNSGRSRRG